MNKVTSVLSIAALALGLSAVSYAGSPSYGLTNDDNPSGNTATVYAATGTGPHQVTVLHATGQVGIGGGYFAAPRNAITSNHNCIFVTNAGSSTISAFHVSTGPLNITLTGSYTGGNGDYAGIGVVASNDDKYLYASFSGDGSLWSYGINASTCALTTISGPVTTGDVQAQIGITSDGNYLLVSLIDFEEITDYALTNGSIAATPFSTSNASSCGFPVGLDATKVSGGNASVVAGEATTSQIFMQTTISNGTLGSGVTCVNVGGLTSTGLGNLESPVLSKAAFSTGSGPAILGYAGFGGGGVGSFADAGFSVNNMSSGTIGTNAVSAYDAYLQNGDGAIYGSNPAVTTVGSNVAVWQVDCTGSATNIVNLYKVASNGAITKLGSVSDSQANGTSFVLSISSFPPR